MTSGKDVTDAPANGERTRKASAGTSVAKGAASNKDMGAALRSVYQKTVEETVPQDLLALLGKLD